MADSQDKSGGSQPPPVTYKNPRRTSPENSITLRYHRLARDAARRNSPTVVPKISFVGSRRNSSGESNDTGVSDAKKWFNRSNENANAVFDSTMDVDPPFYQKETDSSNEDGMKYAVPSQSPAYNFVQSRNQGLVRPGLAHSSSADDYRSVIDDLTVENKKLRDELRRYKQMGPDSLRREKLFEVKVHGLPSRKKRELEAALRDFTTSLDGSSTSASPRAKDKLKAQGKSSMSKHASSSSGSQSRPVPTDSAYASISTGPTSSSASIPGRLVRHGLSEQSVERYLKDIPEGLWPKSTIMTEKDKKKLVVKRLEQLFTGKGSDQLHQQTLSLVPPPISEEVEMRTNNGGIISAEATREAQILPQLSEKISHSRDNVSSNSNGDQSDPKDGGNASGSGSDGPNSNDPPSGKQVPEQRPTRPHDLDPDRIQVPSVNMEYIRHLGLAAPETEAQKRYSSKDVSPDAEGWVYLNLLCNLAQLHMFNVTPAFIRAAVTEKSRQFQLSPDGRKIRWRGGAEGTRFSSESSGSNSPRASEGDTSDGSHGANQRKKQKTVAVARGENDVMITEPSKFGPQVSSSSDSFHYKPLFVHQQSSSSDEQPSFDDETPGSFYGAPEESNFGMNSRWNHSGVSGLSQHQRKRRRDGAIIYYTGAPFCTDLSGDLSEVSPDGSYNNHNLTSLDKKGNSASPAAAFDITAAKAPKLERTTSGSSIPFKPLSNLVSHYAMMDLDFAPPELTPDESYESDDLDAKFPWSDAKEPNISPQLVDFEASGLAGITPEDHFVVSMSTRRPTSVSIGKTVRPVLVERPSQETTISKDPTDSVVGQLAILSTDSPTSLHATGKKAAPKIDITYVAGNLRRLPPAPLPPPTYFFGPMDSEESDSDSSEFSTDLEDDDEGVMSRHRFLRRGRVAPGDEDLTSGDEEDETDNDEADASDSTSPDNGERITADNIVGGLRFGQSSGRVSNLSKITTGSSVATAGGAVSGCSNLGDA